MEFDAGINETYHHLNEHADLVYQFVVQYHDYMFANHSYGSDTIFNMMEIHTLTNIEDNPGVTITELSKMWGKTKSAVSQTVKKLVDQGLVERKQKENNSKTVLLFATEKGQRISYIHKAYDIADITQTTNQLIMRCGEQDLNAFYRVLKAYLELFRDN